MLKKREKEHKLEKNEDFSHSFSKIFFFVFLLINANLLEISSQYFSTCNAQESQILLHNNQELDLIEEKVFHQKFSNESIEERVSRLENFIFGKQNTNEDIDKRINKILTALQVAMTRKKEPVTQQNTLVNEKIGESKTNNEESSKAHSQNQGAEVLYDKAYNYGAFGVISQIESKVFNRTFNDIPFPQRIANLEEKLLSGPEIIRSKKKPLLERLSILVNKAKLLIPPQTNPSNKNSQNTLTPWSYTIDPRTNLLINEQSGEIVRDNLGNPIRVKPSHLQTQQGYQNQAAPFGFYGLPPSGGPTGQPPLDLLFNQNEGYGIEEESEY